MIVESVRVFLIWVPELTNAEPPFYDPIWVTDDDCNLVTKVFDEPVALLDVETIDLVLAPFLSDVVLVPKERPPCWDTPCTLVDWLSLEAVAPLKLLAGPFVNDWLLVVLHFYWVLAEDWAEPLFYDWVWVIEVCNPLETEPLEAPLAGPIDWTLVLVRLLWVEVLPVAKVDPPFCDRAWVKLFCILSVRLAVDAPLALLLVCTVVLVLPF